MTVIVAVVAAMIALNALYVAGEFAAVSVRHTRIRQMAEGGSRTARWLLSIIESSAGLDRYVAGCQIGITLSSLLLGAYGQAAIAPLLAVVLEAQTGVGQTASVGTSAIAVLVVLTTMQVLLGELLPKSVALQFPALVAVYTALPMRVSLWVYRPLIAVLNGSGIAILKLLGAPAPGHRHIHSPQELSMLIADSRSGGLLSTEEQKQFDRALRLSVLPVRRIMVPRLNIVAVEAGTRLRDVQTVFGSSGFTRLPVYEGNLDDVIGVIHAKEVGRRIMAGTGDIPARDVMRRIASVPESMRCERLVAELRRQRSEQAIVVDEHGGVSGLVTLEDLLTEVLGDMESLKAAPQAFGVRLPDGRLRLPGRMRVDEAGEWLGVRWEGESDTLSGIIAEHLGHLPHAGERLTISGVDVEVERVDNMVVATLLARPSDLFPGSEPHS